MLDLPKQEEAVVNEENNLTPEIKIITEVKKPKTNMLKKISVFVIAASMAIGLKTSVNDNIMPTEVITESPVAYEQIVQMPSDSYTTNNQNLKSVPETSAFIPEVLENGHSINAEEVKTSINLEDEIVLKEGSLIYADSYSAVSQTGGQSRYFTANDNRYISGITYSLNGTLETVFSSDPDYQTKIDNLESNSAQVSAVLIKNELGDEGFMSIDDIDVVVRGVSR